MACGAETCNTTFSTVKVEVWLTVLAPSSCMLTNSNSFIFISVVFLQTYRLYTVRTTRKSTTSRPKYGHFLLLHIKWIQIRQVTDRQNRPPHCCSFSFFSGRKQLTILYRGNSRWENNETTLYWGSQHFDCKRGGGRRSVRADVWK